MKQFVDESRPELSELERWGVVLYCLERYRQSGFGLSSYGYTGRIMKERLEEMFRGMILHIRQRTIDKYAKFYRTWVFHRRFHLCVNAINDCGDDAFFNEVSNLLDLYVEQLENEKFLISILENSPSGVVK